MTNLKIGIIEDDLLIAESIVMMLQDIGYQTTIPVRNYDDALQMIRDDKPDILLIDIMLDGNLDGIDVARKVVSDFGLPFIFITANSDKATVDRAKEVRPSAYLVKPFNERDLFSTIEIAFSTFSSDEKPVEQAPSLNPNLKNFVFVKENHLFHKVAISDILYVESDNVYLTLSTRDRNYLVRSKLDDFIASYGNNMIYRIHRSFAINISHLETINSLTVKVGGKEIPLQKPYRQDLLRIIQTI